MSAAALKAPHASVLASADTREFVTLHIADQLFGVQVGDIHDVFALQQLTPVPGAGEEIAGILNLRGRIVTAIDARARLGLPKRPNGYAGMMAVGVERDGEAFGILVDTVGDVLRLEDSRFEPNPVNLDAHWQSVSKGVYRLDGSLLITLDIARILTPRNAPTGTAASGDEQQQS
jgi:purine-binding chemotaxis protein CheW